MAGRGQLFAIQKLPPEADHIVAWANDELRGMKRTQKDIYAEFFSRLQALQMEHRGELEFAIPSPSAFNRYSVMQATLTRRMDTTREISNALAESFDAQSSDNLTILAAEAIKTLVFELITAGGEAGFAPKEAKGLADALRSAAQAQNISSSRRQKVEAEFAGKVGDAVEKVAKAKGLTADFIEQVKAEILGVEAPGRAAA